MRILIIKHTETEGPGTLGEYLQAIPAHVSTVNLYDGEKLPEEVNGHKAIVSMGGPMNAYEEDRFPFLAEEAVFLEQAIESDIPVLGICLGSQMVARACGARVKKAPAGEIGWSKVFLTREGSGDEFFRGVPDELAVLQWHEDTFELPAGGLLLATSRSCPNQAFRYKNAYGLQFHIEVNGRMLSRWFGRLPEWPGIIERYYKVRDDFHRLAGTMYGNFFSRAGIHASERFE